MHGLANLNNTCYINTLVQCIGHVNCLREWLLGRDAHAGAFTKELQHVLHLMWIQKQSLIPQRFVSAVLKVFDLERGEQHDLCEVFLRVIDRLSWEDKTFGVSIEDRAHCRGAAKNAMEILHKMAIKAWKAYHPRGFHSYDAMMEGLQVHQVQCFECKKCFHNFEPFMVMNIDVANGDACITNGIKKYFGVEVLREWTCDQCKQVRPAEKTVRVWQFPNVLAITLKRFAVDGVTAKKVKIPVDIPRELTFHKESAIRGITSGTTRFALRSVGLHHGSMNNGHYTCVANIKNKWIHYDDIDVSEVGDIHAFCSQNTFAYLLIYEREPL